MRPKSCASCRHRSRVGTCREPVAAGLVGAFAIVWPAPGHGDTCPAWSRSPAEAVAAVLIAAAREGWPDAELRAWLDDADAMPEAAIEALRGRREVSA